jgi:hypothetical protein
VPLPLIVKLAEPSPEIRRFSVTCNSPVESAIVWPLSVGLNVMVSPLAARAIASRSEPGPLSALVTTLRVLKTSRASNRSNWSVVRRFDLREQPRRVLEQ